MSRLKFLVLTTFMGVQELGFILGEHMSGSQHEILFRPHATWSQWRGSCGQHYAIVQDPESEDPEVVLVGSLEVWGPWVVITGKDPAGSETAYVLAVTMEQSSMSFHRVHSSGMWWAEGSASTGRSSRA